MSWFQFRRLASPSSSRHRLKAILPGTNHVFSISHEGVSLGDQKWLFSKPIDRQSMSTQLELCRQQIRINHRQNQRQAHILITPKGIFEGKNLLAALDLDCARPQFLEQLDLGNHQYFDVEKNGRNLALEQLLPAWFLLGQTKTPFGDYTFGELKPFYFDHLEDLFAPKSLGVLEAGYRQIRSYFFEQEGPSLQFLPNLPFKLDSGRLCLYPKDLTITFEWSKREVKRIVMQAHATGEWNLNLPGKMQTMRIRKDHKMQNGPIVPSHTISLKKGEYAFLDQFRR